jgi:hypothetical protein
MRVLNEAIKAQRARKRRSYHLSYLPFLSRGGRRRKKPKGSSELDSFITRSYTKAIAAVGKAFESAYAAGQEAAARESWDEGRAAFANAASFAREGATLESLWGSRVYIDKNLSFSAKGAQIISSHLPVLVKYQQAAAAMDQLIFIMRLNGALSDLARRRETAVEESALTVLRNEVREVLREFGSCREIMRKHHVRSTR